MTERERETGREQERERKLLEPVCSFHLLISSPVGSIIDCSRGGVEKRKKKIVKFIPAIIFSITNLRLIHVRYSFISACLLMLLRDHYKLCNKEIAV